MLIKTKYIDCASKSVFNTWKLPTSAADTSGDIYWSAVVYIKDTGEVWTHGKLYGGFFSNADNNKVSLTIGGTTKILALDGHVQSYTTLTGSGSTADQAILSTGVANKWTLKTLGKNAFSNVDYLPADATAVAAEKVIHALAFQYNGKAIHSFDGSVARVLNIIQGDNVFITGDSQGNITIAADSGSDTVNTAGATNLIDRKLFLVGAESQTTSPKTYSNQYVYIGTDNCLYSLGKKVLTEHQAIYNLDLQAQVENTVTKITTFDPNVANNSFTLVQGTNVTLTPDATNKKVTISSKDTTYDFYDLVFKQGDAIIDTYRPTTSPNKIFKAGTNVTLSGSHNEVIISTLDTKNTTGATNKLDTKLFLTGSLTQSDNSQTYTNSKVYIGIDNKLYSDDKVVSTVDHTHNYAGSSSAGGSANSALTLLYTSRVNTTYGNYVVFQQEYNQSSFPHTGWFNSIKMLHENRNGFFTEIATSFTGEDGMWRRCLRDGNEFGWYKLLDSGNYNSYVPTLTGEGASGTWGINVSGYAGALSVPFDTSLIADLNKPKWGKEDGYSINYNNCYGSAANLPQVVNNANLILNIQHGKHGQSGMYGWQVGFFNSPNAPYIRKWSAGNIDDWSKLLTSRNYKEFSPSLTGEGASGTWGISITGNADTLDGNHASAFATSNHTHYLGNKPASDLSSTYQQGISIGGIYMGGYPFLFGCTITASGNGGYFQIAGQWNENVSSLTDNDKPTEMYLRGRRDTYDVWTTWSRVLTNKNYNEYSPTLTGAGASGTWGINISGNAATASKLNNALTLQANGTSLGTYDGSAAKTFNLTYANVGAAASIHTHSYLPLVDSRSIDYAPYSSDFTERGLSSSHLKANSTDGLNDGGSYHASIYIYPWKDNSGGYAHNLAFTDNGNMWLRSGTSEWSSWKKILNSSNYTDYAATKDHTHQYLPLSGGTVSGQLYLTGLEEGDSDITDNTELLTSYASNNGFSDASGKVYKRDAIKVYNYIKGKLDSVYSAIGHTHSYLPLAGGMMTDNARISHSGTLYIGNSDNSGWVALQDICSQNSIGDGVWSIRTNGNAIFTTIKKVGSSDSYTLLGGGGQMAISRFVYANTDFGVQESTGTSDNIGRAQFWRDNDLGAYGVTLCHSQSSEYKTKIYHDYGNGGNLYIKSCSNGTWGGVYTLWNSGNFNPDTKVSKAGDTMTGGLSWVMNGVTSSISNGNSSFTHYNTNASSGHWFNKDIYIAGNVYGGAGYNRILAFKDEINSQVGGSKSAQMLWNSWSTDAYYGGAIQIREYGNVVDTQSAWGYSPAITFHWGNRAASRFGMRSDGLIAVNDVPISLSTHSHTFASITSKPTTIEGYGITDAIHFADTPNYVAARFATQAIANKAASTYIEWWQSGAGFFRHKAAKYIVDGGTSSQFLKGDGSLDSTAYLPLSGGTLTDNLYFSYQGLYIGGFEFTDQFASFYSQIDGTPQLRLYKGYQAPIFRFVGKEHDIYHSGNLTASVIGGLGTLSNNISGNAATATNASNAGNADTLSGVLYQNILERQYSGASSSGTDTGWFRIAETIVRDDNGICFLLAIQRSYSYTDNENYLFSISISFSGGINITQLSGYANYRLITKIRVDYEYSQKAYIDLYISTQTRNNSYYWYTVGNAKSYTGWTVNPTLNGIAYEFETANGCKSDRGFSAIGNISATGAITAKASSSDIRLKTDISDYKALSIIRGHKSIKYHWNAVAKANADVFNDDYWHYGLIAQDVQRDMPQIVSDVFKDYLVINYERLIPICWKGLQEVDDEVSRLKKKVRKLEMEIRELKQKGERL